MKALVRDDEVITEPFNKWTEEHMNWLTTPRPNGDGYKLEENFIPEIEPEISGDPTD